VSNRVVAIQLFPSVSRGSPVTRPPLNQAIASRLRWSRPDTVRRLTAEGYPEGASGVLVKALGDASTGIGLNGGLLGAEKYVGCGDGKLRVRVGDEPQEAKLQMDRRALFVGLPVLSHRSCSHRNSTTDETL
jgi:hypothetical protein